MNDFLDTNTLLNIELLSQEKIRVTITKEILSFRNMKISELAQGTESAKTLFRDIMQEAYLKFGFMAEDIPLMIEAIPVDKKLIETVPVDKNFLVLIISKVKDKNKLDNRFSNFAPCE